MPQDKKSPPAEPIQPKKKGDILPDIGEPVTQPGGDRKRGEGSDRKRDKSDKSGRS